MTSPNAPEFTQQDFMNIINSLPPDIILPSDPWDMERLTESFNQIEELLDQNENLSENQQTMVRNIIILSRQVQHPEDIDPDFLGFYTTNLLCILDTPNFNIADLFHVLGALSQEFNIPTTPIELTVMSFLEDVNDNNNVSVSNSSSTRFSEENYSPEFNIDEIVMGSISSGANDLHS